MSTSRHSSMTASQNAGLRSRLRRDERGTTMVEYALTVALFLFFIFALLDFGRLFYNWVMAEKAMQMAARIAAVRPAVCAGVPQANLRHSASSPDVRFGTSCGAAGSNICEGEELPRSSCLLSEYPTSSTAVEILGRVTDILPLDASDSDITNNIRVSYRYEPEMNFLGGPYVPVVTVEIENLYFEFIQPLFGLLRLSGATRAGDDVPGDILFPSMSVSLPGEDLALGENG